MKTAEQPDVRIVIEDAPNFVSAYQILFNALWEQGKPEIKPLEKAGA